MAAQLGLGLALLAVLGTEAARFGGGRFGGGRVGGFGRTSSSGGFFSSGRSGGRTGGSSYSRGYTGNRCHSAETQWRHRISLQLRIPLQRRLGLQWAKLLQRGLRAQQQLRGVRLGAGQRG